VATETQIELLVVGVCDVLRGDLVGAYLHGSAVLGGFRPDSDIDVIVVSTRRTTADEKRRLIDLLLSTTNLNLASVVTMVLLGDKPLAGPRPAEVFDPVPRSDYIDAILRDTETVDEYLP